jgi:hypothetical protein
MRIGRVAVVGAAVLGVTACGHGLLPTLKQTTNSPWSDFSTAKASYDRVVPGRTTVAELHALGFDPQKTPNVKRMSYLEVITAFMPNPSMRKQDLDPGVRACIEAHDSCYAYSVTPGIVNAQRHGNVLADMFSFHRQTTTTGWKFSALLVIRDDTVAYKVWSGEPNIAREEDNKQPLGPLQNIGAHVDVAPGASLRP